MKRASIILSLLGICAIMLMQFASCEKYVLPEISANKDTLIFSAAGGSLPLELSTNVIWAIETEQRTPWITFDPERGEGSATVTFTAAATPDSTMRHATITLKTEAIKKELLVIQEALK